MQPSRVRDDLAQIERIAKWLDGWSERRRQAAEITGVRRQPFANVSFLRRSHANSS